MTLRAALTQDHGAVARRMLNWTGDVTGRGASLSLLKAMKLGACAGLGATTCAG